MLAAYSMFKHALDYLYPGISDRLFKPKLSRWALCNYWAYRCLHSAGMPADDTCTGCSRRYAPPATMATAGTAAAAAAAIGSMERDQCMPRDLRVMIY